MYFYLKNDGLTIKSQPLVRCCVQEADKFYIVPAPLRPGNVRAKVGLFSGKFLLEGCKFFEVAESSAFDSRGGCRLLFFLSLTTCLACFVLLSLSFVFEDAAVREEDALVVLVEFDYLEGEFLVELSMAAIFLNEMFGSCKTFYAILELYNGTLIKHFDDCTFVDAAICENCFEYIPRILFKLFVTERKTTVVFIYFKNNYFDFCTNLSELRRMFDFLSPRKI